MSPVLEERMLAAIGDAKTCPHGHPIVEGAREQGVLLADVEPGATVHVLRFENEAEELLHYLKEAGLHPGLEGAIESSSDDEVVVASDDGSHEVSRSVAETVSVRADPSPPAAPAAARAAGALQRPLRALSVRAQLAADLAQPAVEAWSCGRIAYWRRLTEASCSRTAAASAEKRRSATLRSLTGSSFRLPSIIVIGVISVYLLNLAGLPSPAGYAGWPQRSSGLLARM